MPLVSLHMAAIHSDVPEMRKTRTSNRTTCTASAEVNHKAPKQPASLPTKRPTLDERMETVMERVETAGFDSFDALATLYYKAKFGDSSSLAVEQRLSRNRRLPKLFADVFSAAQEWGAREQRPLFDEILRISEGMLISEARGVHSTLHASIGGLARSAKDERTGKSAVPGLKRLMESNRIEQYDSEIARIRYWRRYWYCSALVSYLNRVSWLSWTLAFEAPPQGDVF
ncbi:hypothetical protein N0V85_002587 [Neurospora sp. IMI 360204]|nr:hypothetical protein N0V85_002587 [Neurospora sp. IMI 360204]